MQILETFRQFAESEQKLESKSLASWQRMSKLKPHNCHNKGCGMRRGLGISLKSSLRVLVLTDKSSAYDKRHLHIFKLFAVVWPSPFTCDRQSIGRNAFGAVQLIWMNRIENLENFELIIQWNCHVCDDASSHSMPIPVKCSHNCVKVVDQPTDSWDLQSVQQTLASLSVRVMRKINRKC